MLRLISSNRFEVLREALFRQIDGEVRDVLRAPQVIVPSAAVRRRLEIDRAERDGICANVAFSYLGEWTWRQMAQFIAVQETSPFASDLLAWRVLALLDDAAFTSAYPRLANYCARSDAVMTFELAQRIAALLEQYVTYRPDWLEVWVGGRHAVAAADDPARVDETWQAALWRRIATDLGAAGQHPSVAFLDAVVREDPADLRRSGRLPPAHLFALPTVPPLYLRILRELGRFTDVTMYVLNPCREYWFDIVDRKRLRYLEARDGHGYRESGNPLLAAWGQQTQAYVDLLFDDDGSTVEEGSAFLETGSETLLARVQDAILDLRELGPGSIRLDPADRSIEVHVCHSLTRQLEVLQDQLLALFAGPDPPPPSEVLVALPDLATAAPLIDAVFGTAPADRRIPYQITGLPQQAVNPLAQAFDMLLQLAASRFAAADVFDLLQQEVVARRYDLAAAELDSVREWIAGSGARWGLDGAQRREAGVPAEDKFTWSDGLDRLYYAYACGPDAAERAWTTADDVFDHSIGAGDPAGSEALALGRVWRFVEDLRWLRGQAAQPRPPAAWSALLLDALARFFLVGRQQAELLRAVQAAIGAFQDETARAGFALPLPLATVHAALLRQLEAKAPGAVPTGAVTFASLSSMRALPYRVVCLLGLDDGVFPSASRPDEFDLAAGSPRRGDRQRRQDERNLFLDLLLAARERLYLGYTGFDVRDSSPRPASVLLEELLDHLAEACAPPVDDAGEAALSFEAAQAEVRRRLVVEHRLQPFSPEYFRVDRPDRDPRLRSFNREYCEALRQRAAVVQRVPEGATDAASARPQDERAMSSASPQNAPTSDAEERSDPTTTAQSSEVEVEGEEDRDSVTREPFFREPLPPPEESWHSVTTENLARFFRNPCRVLLRRLQVALPDEEPPLANEEPFVPNRQDRAALARRLLPAALAGIDASGLTRIALAGRDLPPGAVGDRLVHRDVAGIDAFARPLRRELAAPEVEHEPTRIECSIEGEHWELVAAFPDLRTSGLVRFHYGPARAYDFLSAWLCQLCLSARPPAGSRPVVRWHTDDMVFSFAPVECPERHIEALLGLYRTGLMRPLHFFPKAALAYVESDRSVAAARRAWHSTSHAKYKEDSDAAYRIALRGTVDPLDAEFVATALTVFQPLLAHLQKEAR